MLETVPPIAQHTSLTGDKSFTMTLNKLAGYLTVAHMQIAALTLAGWIFSIDIIKQPLPNVVAMNTVTALCFLLVGSSFLFMNLHNKTQAVKTIRFALLMVPLLIGVLRISEGYQLLDFKIDQIFHSEESLAQDSINGQSRMAISTAICFVLLSLSMMLLYLQDKRMKALSNTISLTVFSMGLFMLVGYLYHVSEFFDLKLNDPMAFRTAISFVLASMAVILSQPSGIFSIIGSTNQGGRLARLLIPATIIIPIVFGFLRLTFQWKNPIRVEFGVALLILAIVLTFLIVSLFIAYLIGEKDNLHKNAELKFQGILEAAPDAMVIVDKQGLIQIINAQTEKLFGYTRSELLGQKVEILIPSRFAMHHPHARAGFHADAKTRSMGSGLDLFGKKKSGDEFPVEISLSPFHTENGIFVSAAIRDITERKNAAHVLELVKKDFQLLVSSVKDYAIFLVDKKGFVVSWNSGAEHIKGYKASEIIGQSIEVFYPEKVRNHEPKRNLELALKHGRFETEGPRLRKDGAMFYANIVLTALFDDHGVFYGYAKVTKDISEKRKAEAHMRFLASIANNIQDIVITSDSQFRITRWNEAAERLLEWKSNEVIGKTPGEFLNIQYPDEPREKILDTFSKVGYWKGEMIYHTKSGIPISVLSTASLMKDAEGEPMGNLIVARDISDRKKTEVKLKEFEHFFNNSNDLSCIANKEGYFEIINPSFEKVLGYTKQELIKKPFLDFVHADDIAATLQVYDQLRSGKPVISFTNRYRNIDGSYLWFDWNATPNPVTGKLYCIARDITERRNAEEALHALNKELEQKVAERIQEIYTKEKRFRTLIENSHDVISLLDESFSVIYRSPSAFRITGWTDEELDILPSKPNIHPDDLEYLQGIIKIVRDNPGKPIDVLFRNQHKKGHYLWLEGSVVNLLEDENIHAIVFNFRDVTERVKSNEILNSERLLLRTLIDNIPDYIYVKDIHSRHLINNKANVDLLGATSEIETIGKTVAEFIPPEIAMKYLEHDEEILRTGTAIFNHEETIVSNTGELKYLLTTKVPLRNEHDKVIGLVGVSRDITWQKKAEEQIRESEKIYRTIAASMPDTSVILLDTDYRYLLVEGQLTNMLGYTREQLLGNLALEVLQPDRYNEMLPNFIRVFHGEMFEAYFDRGNFHITAKFVPFRDESDQIYAAMIVTHDITKIKLAEIKLAELNAELELKVEKRTAQLETANKELESFSYSVSHDLRAPLRAINGYAKMLEEDYNSLLDNNGNRLIAIVRENARQMGQLIDDLLAFSRLGRKEIQKEEVNMEILVHDVIKETTLNTPPVDIKINTLHPVYGDKALLKQVVFNYLSNAIKYSSKTEKPVVEIKSKLVNDEVIYAVTDNGTGFDMNYVHKLFNVFQRLHSHEEFEGTGVGLAIVSRIITKHNGRVWAEGELGKGASFYFSLPTKR